MCVHGRPGYGEHLSGFLARPLALTFIAASALWSIHLGTSWAFDTVRYPFEDAVEYSSINLGSIKTADLTGDGHLDLIGGGASGDLEVAKGNGDGTFEPPEVIAPEVSSGRGGLQYTVGDANRDGQPDIALRRPGGPTGNEIAVLVNDGAGAFTTTDVIPVSSSTGLWALARFGADANEDLLTLEAKGLRKEDPTSTISVLPGAGDGTFDSSVPSTVSVGAIPSGEVISLVSGASADVDGDGIRDPLIGTVVNGQGGDTLVMKGDADGHFEGAVSTRLYGPNGITTGDLNGDGLPDLVGLDQGATGINPWVAVNVGGLDFAPGVLISTAEPGPLLQMSLPAIADFDGDGYGDVVGPSTRFQPAGVSYGSPGGALTPMDGNAVSSTNPGIHTGAAAGDFNEDGLPDVAVGGSSLAVLLHKPAPDDAAPPADGVLSDVSTSGTGLNVLKHHFPKSVPQLLHKGVTATVSCEVSCELTSRLVARSGSVKAFHLPRSTLVRTRATIQAGRVVKVRVRPTRGMAKRIAGGAASGKGLRYGLRFTSTPAS